MARSLSTVAAFIGIASAFTHGQEAVSTPRGWDRDVVYYALIDRFLDGDAANNVPEGSDPALYDKAQVDRTKYHGGDLRGLELALEKNYFRELGVTALCISPPVKNSDSRTGEDGTVQAGYLGLWPVELQDIDPRVASATSLDGKPYPDGREGRIQHYKDFVAQAHAQGLKVVQEIVLKTSATTEGDDEKPGAEDAAPKVDAAKATANSVEQLVEAYAFYAEEVGIDGFRIAAADREPELTQAFADGLRAKLGEERAKEFILVGDSQQRRPKQIGALTYRADGKDGVGLDSVLNAPLCSGVRDYLRPTIGPFGPSQTLAAAFRAMLPRPVSGESRPRYNPTPGADGLPAAAKLWQFVDGPKWQRFRFGTMSARQNQLAQAMLMVGEGVPCIYYGAEADLADTEVKSRNDAVPGPMTFINAGQAAQLDALKQSPTFQTIAALARMRGEMRGLHEGTTGALWSDSPDAMSDDGVFAFARYIKPGDDVETEHSILIVFNPGQREHTTSAGKHVMKLVSRSGVPLLNRGDKLQRLRIPGIDDPKTVEKTFEVQWHQDVPQIDLILAPQSVNIYRVKSAPAPAAEKQEAGQPDVSKRKDEH